ncbi:hypothetical protein FVEG_09297 [Fusarium verticillioides 7600]|uniref:Protein kinase domain-containing protein n=1 Tax=Gibberella moniliformis (strain M3125 / FGSC 7600) TaxID=334819 RepID=W7MQF6_GIBM7|nr:hypothetical protein FVEG_09297 [Fusarium verticillioides 7600]EWG49949.1 hypothetical protein FVEG_09297 [Fusarium verticillioides 7600]RBQ99780.1 hypothetical protein FVER53263_09297 [Fusarium verticillioides]
MPTLKPLPDCEGPKLECFTDDLTKHDFKFLEYLGFGCHSAVFKAEIDGKIYLIKLFFPVFVYEPNFELDPIDQGFDVDRYEKERLTASEEMPQHVVDSLRVHATSFNNECRAYGRLKELGREHLAGKVHGYLRLYLHQIDEQIQAAVQSSLPGAILPSVEVMEMEDDEVDLPIMAIVKDWIPEHRTPTGGITREAEQRQIKHLPRMLRNLRELHKCGIVVRDLKSQQYYEGQLCDLSHARTIPHIFSPESGIRPRWTFASMAAWDLKCFQDIIEETKVSALRADPPLKPTELVATRNEARFNSLRPRPSMQGPFLPLVNYDEGGTWNLDYYPSHDPALFNWRAIQKRATKNSAVRIPEKPAAAVSMKRKSPATEEAKARPVEEGNNKKRRR